MSTPSVYRYAENITVPGHFGGNFFAGLVVVDEERDRFILDWEDWAKTARVRISLQEREELKKLILVAMECLSAWQDTGSSRYPVGIEDVDVD